ncbi:MAG: hypothetical protein ACRDNY_11420 [Gaiellaceae bacterium]
MGHQLRRARILVAALFALVFPSLAGASHSWNGHHWERTSAERTLTIAESVTSSYSPQAVRDNWDDPVGAIAFSLASKGEIKAESKSFGNSGWIGLAQIWIQGGHIVKGQVKLNEFYYPFYPDLDRPEVRQQVYCQELGHVLGLDHQDVADSCMNDENDLFTTAYPEPSGHDVNQLNDIYNHLDESGGGGGGGNGGGPPCEKNPSHPNCQLQGPFVVDVVPAPGNGLALGR